MKRKIAGCCLALSVALAGTPVWSADPGDSSIKAALYDIEKYENESARYTPERKSNINRALKLLDITRQRLDASTNKDHASWIEADQRLTALQDKLNAMLNGGTTAAAEPAQAAAPAATSDEGAAEPIVAEAEKTISEYEGLYQRMQPGDVPTANQYLADLEQLGNKLKSARNKSHSLWRAVVARYNKLNQDIVAKAKQPAPVSPEPAGQLATAASQLKSGAVEPMPSWAVARLNRYERSLLSLKIDIERGGAKSLQDKNEVASYRNGLQHWVDEINNLQLPEQPEVQRVLGIAKEAQTILESAAAEAEQQVAALGDIHGKMAEIEAYAQATPLPEDLKLPFTPEQATAFANQIKDIVNHADEHRQFLTMIKEKAQLNQKASTVDGKTIYGMDDVQRQLYWYGNKRFEDANEILKRSVENIELNADASRDLDWYEKLDPNKPAQSANNFLGEGDRQTNMERLNTMRNNTLSVLALNKALGVQDSSKWDRQLERIDKAMGSYDAKYAEAKKNIRMPEAQSTDAKLLAIAKETLANPKYGANPIERMVINSKLRTREKKTGDIEHGTVTSTLTIYDYKWDEFQVATAERVGETYYLFYNTLKYFYSGDSTTPIDVWILGDRFQGSEIPKENINK